MLSLRLAHASFVFLCSYRSLHKNILNQSACLSSLSYFLVKLVYHNFECLCSYNRKFVEEEQQNNDPKMLGIIYFIIFEVILLRIINY